MNRFESLFKPLMWFMALLLAAFAAGCGGDDEVAAGTYVNSLPAVALQTDYGNNADRAVATLTVN